MIKLKNLLKYNDSDEIKSTILKHKIIHAKHVIVILV